ncbi:MAG: CRTAC1 family protein [Halioglobus sp.]
MKTLVSRLLITLFPLILSTPAIQAEPVRFTEEAASKGLAFQNTDAQSVAWVDFNGDGWLDLWLSGHQMWTRFYRSKLYLSHRGESFGDIWPSLHQGPFKTDAHGSAWVDVDNDGDQDLFVVGGGQSGRAGQGDPNLLFLQQDGKLIERGSERGLAMRAGRGRRAYWLDDDNDGRLDVFVTNVPRADKLASHNLLLRQDESGNFSTVTTLGPELELANPVQMLLAPGTLPHALALPVKTAGSMPALPLWLASKPRRAASGDFNGDSVMDYLIYTPHRLIPETCHVPSAQGSVLGYMPRETAQARRLFEFRANGPVKLNTDSSPLMSSWLGSASDPEDYGSRILSAIDPEYHTDSEETIPPVNGMRISYDKQRETWAVEVHQEAAIANAVQFILTPLEQSTKIEALAIACQYQSPFKQVEGFTFDGATGKRQALKITGLDERLMAAAMVPGDFDNDGDLDIYVDRATPHRDLPDLILENLGKGKFHAQSIAADYRYQEHGLYLSDIIPGPHLSVGDYDNNGFLDVFLAVRYYYSDLENPRNMAGVPNRLLTNEANDNHWIKLNLVGRSSNRDAIGSRVVLTLGKTRQLRYQRGGIDGLDQHMRLLHFGLGSAEQIDRLVVHWPSGAKSTVKQTAVDTVLTLIEPELDPQTDGTAVKDPQP